MLQLARGLRPGNDSVYHCLKSHSVLKLLRQLIQKFSEYIKYLYKDKSSYDYILLLFHRNMKCLVIFAIMV